jgi:hypothetical protein
MELRPERIEKYPSSVIGERITLESMTALGESAVLHTMGPSHFGHEHISDRAQILLWAA